MWPSRLLTQALLLLLILLSCHNELGEKHLVIVKQTSEQNAKKTTKKLRNKRMRSHGGAVHSDRRSPSDNNLAHVHSQSPSRASPFPPYGNNRHQARASHVNSLSSSLHVTGPQPPQPTATEIRSFGTLAGLLGCMADRSICIDTLFCYCCQVGRQFSALEGHANKSNWLMCCVALGFVEFVPCCLRCRVADFYGVERQESCVVSCLKGGCCCLCSVCETGRILKSQGANPGGLCVPSLPTTDNHAVVRG